MPTRNLGIIGLAVLISLACYSVTAQNRYSRILAHAMELIDREALVVVPERELFDSAMNGMLQGLDKNSTFISADQFQAHEERIKQEIVGVGIEFKVDSATSAVRVEYVMPKAPAANAGIRIGDLIFSVDGRSIVEMATKDIVASIRGPRGNVVTFGIKRDGNDAFQEIEVKRDRVQIDSVKGDRINPQGDWEFVLKDAPQIGYIRLTQFGERSSDEMRVALDSIRGKTSALILDLRSNTGGLLDQAVEVCDFFIEPGKLVVEIRRRSQQEEALYTTKEVQWDASIPMVVLVNQNSASASEIVAACLQDYGRAKVAGCQSYGKGTVQDIIPLEYRRSSLSLTTASYWRPSGQNIDRTVLIPEKEGQYGVKPLDPALHILLSEEEDIAVSNERKRRDRLTAGEPNHEEAARPLVSDRQLEAVLDYLYTLLRPNDTV